MKEIAYIHVSDCFLKVSCGHILTNVVFLLLSIKSQMGYPGANRLIYKKH